MWCIQNQHIITGAGKVYVKSLKIKVSTSLDFEMFRVKYFYQFHQRYY